MKPISMLSTGLATLAVLATVSAASAEGKKNDLEAPFVGKVFGRGAILPPGDAGLVLPHHSRLVDLTGTWRGDDWGTVTLKKNKDGGFEGTYTDTYGSDPGTIALKWSSQSQRFDGTWAEGEDRGGKLSIRVLADGSIRGAWTTKADCKIRPGIPALADLEWTTVDKKPRVDKQPAGKAKPAVPGRGFQRLDSGTPDY